MRFLSNHIVCSLFALIWSPYPFSIVLFYFNLIFFVLYCVAIVFELQVYAFYLGTQVSIRWYLNNN